MEILQREFGYPKVYSEGRFTTGGPSGSHYPVLTDLGPSRESTGSPYLGADDHWPLLPSRTHAFARICARRDQEGIHSALLRRVSGGTGCGRPASTHRRPSDGIEHRTSGRQSTYKSRPLKTRLTELVPRRRELCSDDCTGIEAPTRACFTVRNCLLRIRREANHRKSLCRSPFDWSLYVVDSNSDPASASNSPSISFPAHQIRVHLQYLGHPIANDPVYSEIKIWARSDPIF